MWEVDEMRDARHAAAMRQTVESVDEEPAEFRPAPAGLIFDERL